MTKTETEHALEHPCFNKAYFARKLYPDRTFGSATGTFHNKLKWGRFSTAEINRINLIFKEIVNSEI